MQWFAAQWQEGKAIQRRTLGIVQAHEMVVQQSTQHEWKDAKILQEIRVSPESWMQSKHCMLDRYIRGTLQVCCRSWTGTSVRLYARANKPWWLKTPAVVAQNTIFFFLWPPDIARYTCIERRPGLPTHPIGCELGGNVGSPNLLEDPFRATGSTIWGSYSY